MFRRPAATHNVELAPAIDRLTGSSSEGDVGTALAPLFDFLAGDAATRDTVTQFLADLDAVSDGIDDADFKMRFQTYVSRNDPPSMLRKKARYSRASCLIPSLSSVLTTTRSTVRIAIA